MAQSPPAPTVDAPATSADQPASREDVLKLFDVMQIHTQMTTALDAVAKQQRAMAHDLLRKRIPNITEEKLASYDSVIDENMRDLPLDDIISDMVPIYQKHLSNADVNTMVAFYSSPTGQKVLNQMPEMTTEAMQAASGRIEQHQRETMDKLEKMLKENTPPAKPKAKPTPPAKPTT
jgi:hypothetical protein